MQIVVDQHEMPTGYTTVTQYEDANVRVCMGGGQQKVFSVEMKALSLQIIGGESFKKFVEDATDPASMAILYVAQEPSRVFGDMKMISKIIMECLSKRMRYAKESGRRDKAREIREALGIDD